MSVLQSSETAVLCCFQCDFGKLLQRNKKLGEGCHFESGFETKKASTVGEDFSFASPLKHPLGVFWEIGKQLELHRLDTECETYF